VEGAGLVEVVNFDSIILRTVQKKPLNLQGQPRTGQVGYLQAQLETQKALVQAKQAEILLWEALMFACMELKGEPADASFALDGSLQQQGARDAAITQGPKGND
jgi:hypothetical protein